MKNMLLIDGNSLINRAFYALPMLNNAKGEPTQAVYGFTMMLVKAIEEYQPKYIAVAFDRREPTFRHKMYTGYKATRKGMPDDLAVQIPILKEQLKLMKIQSIEKAGYEADDIIGTLSRDDSVQTYIITGDRDSLQLINDTTNVVLTKRGITETTLVTKSTLKEQFNLTPQQVVEYKALAGDSSDNIPGIAGIGEKTAMGLLEKYGTLEGVYQSIECESAKLKEKLENGKEIAFLSHKLATIDCNVPLEITTQDCEFEYPFSSQVFKFFENNGFRSLTKRTELFVQGSVDNQKVEKSNVVSRIIKSETEFNEYLADVSNIAISFADDIEISKDGKENVKIATKQTLIDDGINVDCIMQILSPIMQNKKIHKVMFDAKCVVKRFRSIGIEINNYDDVKLMQYLIDMNAIRDDIVETFDELGYGKTDIAVSLHQHYKMLKDELSKEGLTYLYERVELPLVNVLADMEMRGIAVDENKLNGLGIQFCNERDKIAEKIYKYAGKRFNINSPKQLAEVLFDDLKIPYPKKSAKQSTSAEILDMIVDKHEIVPLCLKWRLLSKLYGTYVDGLRKLLQNGAVHTEYKQMLTTTGRLSSVEPNLQNIPVREEEGRMIRGVFTARKGYKFVSADYSQIELRLLAHYSNDKLLIELFKNGEDIHSHTASELFGVPLSEVTSAQRRAAKIVNFGIVYGISDYTLAQNLHMRIADAKQYTDKYFERFPSIKPYLEKSITQARERGYSKTLMGRKRYIPELLSDNYSTRLFGERVAMNTPLQGTSADIIKLAMVEVSKRLKESKSYLVLQVHDELVIEAHESEIEQIKIILKESMENAMQLNVPLTVDVSEGETLYEC